MPPLYIPFLAMNSVIQQDPAPKSRIGRESISGFNCEIIAPTSCNRRPIWRPFKNGSERAGLGKSSLCVLGLVRLGSFLHYGANVGFAARNCNDNTVRAFTQLPQPHEEAKIPLWSKC